MPPLSVSIVVGKDTASPQHEAGGAVVAGGNSSAVVTDNNSSEDEDDTRTSDNDAVDADGDEQEEPSKVMRWFLSPKLLLGSLLLGLIIFVIADTATAGHVPDSVKAVLHWVEENAVGGFFIFILVFFTATVILIPGSILTVGAGVVFSMSFGLGPGVVIGTIAVFLGASLGATASFLLARYLLREQVGKLSKKYAVFEAVDLAMHENGLKIFILLRLSPISPFNVVNYVGGVSSVSLRDYWIALFAIIPGTVLYVFLGASAMKLADSSGENRGSRDSTATIFVVVLGSFFGILAIWVTTWYARRELQRILEQRRVEAGPVATDVENAQNDDDVVDDGETQQTQPIIEAVVEAESNGHGQ